MRLFAKRKTLFARKLAGPEGSRHLPRPVGRNRRRPEPGAWRGVQGRVAFCLSSLLAVFVASCSVALDGKSLAGLVSSDDKEPGRLAGTAARQDTGVAAQKAGPVGSGDGGTRAQPGATDSALAKKVPAGKFSVFGQGKTNPIAIAGTTPPIDTRISKLLGIKSASGYVSKVPAVEVEVNPSGENVDFLAWGVRSIVVVSARDGKVWRKVNEGRDFVRLGLSGWPGGKAVVYLGSDYYYASEKIRRFGLFITDPARPVDYGWKDAPVVKAASLGEPKVFEVSLEQAGIYSADHVCEYDTVMAAQPSAYLELDSARDDIYIAPARPKYFKNDVVLWGPVGSKKPRCYMREANSRRFPRLEAGRYAVLVMRYARSFDPSKGVYSWNAVAFTGKTRIDPYFFMPVAPNLPLANRKAFSFMPFLDYRRFLTEGMVAGGANIKLMARVPRELVVFTRRKLTTSDTSYTRQLVKGTEPRMPEAGEPVVILQNYGKKLQIMTVDGNIYNTAAVDALTTERPARVNFPKRVRNTRFRYSLEHPWSTDYYILDEKLPPKGDPARKPLVAYKKLIRKYDKCVKRVWRPVEREVGVLRNMANPTSRDLLRLRRLEDKYGKKETRICKPKRVERARLRYYEGMVERERRRRAAIMKKAIAHLKKILAV